MLKTLLLGLVMNAAAERNVVQRCEAVWDLTLALPGERYSGRWCEGAGFAVTFGNVDRESSNELVGTLKIEQDKLRLELARDSAPEQSLWLGLALVSATAAQPLKSTQAGAAKAILQLQRRDGDAVYLYLEAKAWFSSEDPKLAGKGAALLELDAELFVEAKVPSNALQSLEMALALRTRV